MGWWKISNVAEGRVDTAHRSAGAALGEKCCNAVPGVDNPEARYNGDGPADVMGPALDEIAHLYKEAWGRFPSRAELRAVFNFCANAGFDDANDNRSDPSRSPGEDRYYPFRNPDGSRFVKDETS